MKRSSLLPCRACARHVFDYEIVCPFCGTGLESIASKRAIRAGGVAAALVAAACGGITTDDSTLERDGGGSDVSMTADGQGGARSDAADPDHRIIIPQVEAAVGSDGTADAAAPDACAPWEIYIDGQCSVLVYKSPPPRPA
jgi:hypothetical protein